MHFFKTRALWEWREKADNQRSRKIVGRAWRIFRSGSVVPERMSCGGRPNVRSRDPSSHRISLFPKSLSAPSPKELVIAHLTMASEIELSHLRSQRTGTMTEQQLDYDREHEVDESATHYALPPVDGGRRAWAFLAGATVVEMLVWGFPYSIGILHAYWSNTLFKGYGESAITLASTLQTGLLYMSCAIFGP